MAVVESSFDVCSLTAGDAGQITRCQEWCGRWNHAKTFFHSGTLTVADQGKPINKTNHLAHDIVGDCRSRSLGEREGAKPSCFAGWWRQ